VASDSSDPAAVLVGMPELVVRAAVEEGGEVWVLVETPAAVTACAGCGCRAVSKGRRRSRVRDLEVAGRPVVLVWDKRRWRCPDPDCDVGSWTERISSIAPRAVLSERARYEVFRRIGEEARSVAEVAKAFGVAWATAWAAFEAHARAAVDDADRITAVVALGIDETGFLAATPDASPHLRHRPGRRPPGPAVRRHRGSLRLQPAPMAGRQTAGVAAGGGGGEHRPPRGLPPGPVSRPGPCERGGGSLPHRARAPRGAM
jgi:zinc-finger of transposase IS204/IS1001/IS1096/IS1165/Helix-turn-helix domain of transposase family ISL3